MSLLTIENECKTLSVEDCANILGISRTSAYALANKAVSSGKPFSVVKLGSKLLVSKKSFQKYLEDNNL
jgi:response regulator of citrate/malate metabolism